MRHATPPVRFVVSITASAGRLGGVTRQTFSPLGIVTESAAARMEQGIVIKATSQ